MYAALLLDSTVLYQMLSATTDQLTIPLQSVSSARWKIPNRY